MPALVVITGEIAELLAFCASDKPGYLTGTDILCDGGTRAGLTRKGMLAMARGLYPGRRPARRRLTRRPGHPAAITTTLGRSGSGHLSMGRPIRRLLERSAIPGRITCVIHRPLQVLWPLPGVAAPAVTCRRYRMRAQPAGIVLVDSLAGYRSARSRACRTTNGPVPLAREIR